MKYDLVQQSLEEWLATQWAATTAIQFDNVGFNSDAYNEYLRSTVVFGEGLARAITKGWYRQTGVWLLSVLTRPGEGSARKLLLANQATELVRSAVIYPVAPLDAPVVKMKVPDLFNDNKEHSGWVMAQVSCSFYYDIPQVI